VRRWFGGLGQVTRWRKQLLRLFYAGAALAGVVTAWGIFRLAGSHVDMVPLIVSVVLTSILTPVCYAVDRRLRRRRLRHRSRKVLK
jgi:CHASE2 domain-containing sensor protein